MKHVRPNVSQFAARWTQAQPITEPEKPKLKPRPQRRNRIPILETPDLPHEEREADENVSVEAVNDGKRAAENVACFVNDAGYRRNVRAYRKEIREIRPDNGRVKSPGQPAAAFDGFPPSSGWVYRARSDSLLCPSTSSKFLQSPGYHIVGSSYSF